MDFICQKEALEELRKSCDHNHHSLLIEGIPGSGKTYLAKTYAKLLHIDNVQIVKSSVSEIRDAMDLTYKMTEPIVLCIENLDKGVPAASYTLLKFLEEPQRYVYIVVTCRDRRAVPETIVSRSVVITINNPTDLDLDNYALRKNSNLTHQLKHTDVYRCARSFTDIDTLFSFDVNKIKNLQDNVNDVLSLKDNVNSSVWKLTHFQDNTEMPVQFVLRYMMSLKPSNVQNLKNYRRKILNTVNDLSRGSLGTHAVMSKLVMDLKYGD